MALIKCPECGTEVSDKAAACPKCGCPIAEENTRGPLLADLKQEQKDTVQTIELTGKRYKVQLLFASLLIIVGAGIVCSSVGSDLTAEELPFFGSLLAFIRICEYLFFAEELPFFGFLLAVGGFIWFIVTKIRIWWHHR